MTTRDVSDHSRVVTAVVCAAFDGTTDAAVLAVRELVRATGVDLPPQPRHRPHFSLAAARVAPGAELERLVAVAAEVAADHVPIEVVLAEVGRFSRAGVLWLGPSASPQLGMLQRAVVAALADAGWPPAFAQRTDWVPHCTLATRLATPRLPSVQAAVRDRFRPIPGRVDALATILVGGHGDVGRAALGRPAQ